jgi:hypothetical protein
MRTKYIIIIILVLFILVNIFINKDTFVSFNTSAGFVQALQSSNNENKNNKIFKNIYNINIFNISTEEKIEEKNILEQELPKLTFYSYEKCPKLYKLFKGLTAKVGDNDINDEQIENVDGLRFRNKIRSAFYNIDRTIKIEHPLIEIERKLIPVTIKGNIKTKLTDKITTDITIDISDLDKYFENTYTTMYNTSINTCNLISLYLENRIPKKMSENFIRLKDILQGEKEKIVNLQNTDIKALLYKFLTENTTPQILPIIKDYQFSSSYIKATDLINNYSTTRKKIQHNDNIKKKTTELNEHIKNITDLKSKIEASSDRDIFKTIENINLKTEIEKNSELYNTNLVDELKESKLADADEDYGYVIAYFKDLNYTVILSSATEFENMKTNETKEYELLAKKLRFLYLSVIVGAGIVAVPIIESLIANLKTKTKENLLIIINVILTQYNDNDNINTEFFENQKNRLENTISNQTKNYDLNFNEQEKEYLIKIQNRIIDYTDNDYSKLIEDIIILERFNKDKNKDFCAMLLLYVYNNINVEITEIYDVNKKTSEIEETIKILEDYKIDNLITEYEVEDKIVIEIDSIKTELQKINTDEQDNPKLILDNPNFIFELGTNIINYFTDNHIEQSHKQVSFNVKTDFTEEDVVNFVEYCFNLCCFGAIDIDLLAFTSNHYRVLPCFNPKHIENSNTYYYILPERIRKVAMEEGKEYTRAKCNGCASNIIIFFDKLPDKFKYYEEIIAEPDIVKDKDKFINDILP